jgi:hypothetical protein
MRSAGCGAWCNARAEPGKLAGDFHRHGLRIHAHPHAGGHRHDRGRHSHAHGTHPAHPHSHGLAHDTIKRSRDGLTAVGGLARRATALAQALTFVLTGSVALLADLIHNFGDAATAIPLGTVFLLRSQRAGETRKPALRAGFRHSGGGF